MNKLILSALLCAPVFASQSITLPSGTSLGITVPSSSPYNSLGDNRFVARIHTWGLPAGGVTSYMAVGFVNFGFDSSGRFCGWYGNDNDDQSWRGNQACVPASGLTDILVRLQRLGSSFPADNTNSGGQQIAGLGETVLEVWNAATGVKLASGCATNGGNVGLNCPIGSFAAPSNYSGGFGFQPPSGVSFSIAYFKWYTTTVAPGGPFTETETSANGDLADFRFEGSCAATAGSVTISGSRCTGGFTTTPTENPFCQINSPAAPFQTFRVGIASQLANNSFPLDGGGSLGYSWSQIAGGNVAGWSSTSVAQPAVTGPAAGSYTFQVVLTDGSANSTTCSIKDGFVIADALNRVDTGNAQINQLIGTPIMFGANPWTWFDNRDYAEAQLQTANLATYYTLPSAGTGTITVTDGSSTVTGSGTTFLADFCGGSVGPGVSSASLVVWYVIGGVNVGRRWMPVKSCASNTSLTFGGINGPQQWNQFGNLPTQSAGISYNVENYNTAIWNNNAGPPNFYDAVLAFYNLYYRSGIDDYLTSARTLADRFWQYRMDQGRNYYTNEGFSTFPRNWAPMGMFVRAIDGGTNYWAGLELLANWSYTKLSGAFPWTQNGLDIRQNWDARETGTTVWTVALAALLDPNATNAATYRTECQNIMTSGVNNAVDVSGMIGFSFYWANSGGGTPGGDSWDSGAAATVTNGSTTVTCSGCNWQSNWFAPTMPWAFTTIAANTQPTNNSQFDSTVYFPSYVSATQMTLDQPYQGTTSSTKGWAASFQLSTTPYNVIGYGCQPYMCGIFGTALDYLAKALTCTSVGVPTNCSNTIATQAEGYVVTVANWLRVQGYWPTAGGLHYFAGFLNCQYPIADSNVACNNAYNYAQSRQLSPEGLREILSAVTYNGDRNLKAFGDTLYTKSYGKPGYGLPAGQASDGVFSLDYQDAVGFFMVGTPPSGEEQKYFGFLSGVTLGATWPTVTIFSGSSVSGGIMMGGIVK